MPRGYNNYSFVIDSSFQPFTMQEMLTPFLMYKEAFEKSEEAYNDLTNKADKFKYLADNLDPNSKAAQIYNGYADTLRAQATDLAQNGLTMGNRRALTGLKQRYQGEIGRLVDADTALKQEQALRRQMSAKDPSMLYGTDNLNIDMFLDNNTPNLYSISGTDLYTKGAAAGKAASARIYSDPKVKALDKYYNDYFNTVGYSPEKMQEFRNNLAAIPELQKAAMDIAEANKVGELGEGSVNYNAALKQIINGIADGAIYQRQSNMQRNLGQMTASELAADARARESQIIQRESMNRQAAAQGLTWNPSTNSFDYDIRKDPKYSKDLWKYDIDETTGQIKDYSEAYKDAIKKGIVKDGDKIGGSGKNTNTPQEPLKKDVTINANGQVSAIKTGQTWGTKASFEEAKKVNPHIEDYHRGYENYYDYYINGEDVTIIATKKNADALKQDDLPKDGIYNPDDEY